MGLPLPFILIYCSSYSSRAPGKGVTGGVSTAACTCGARGTVYKYAAIVAVRSRVVGGIPCLAGLKHKQIFKAAILGDLYPTFAIYIYKEPAVFWGDARLSDFLGDFDQRDRDIRGSTTLLCERDRRFRGSFFRFAPRDLLFPRNLKPLASKTPEHLTTPDHIIFSPLFLSE